MLTRPITRGITRPITRPLVRQSSTFNPLTLFAQGQQGAWYDPSDLTTLFQDAAGTTPVTADGDPVGYMQDLSGNGNHATQSVSASRPIYRTDGTLHWLSFDGVDDALDLPQMIQSPEFSLYAAVSHQNLGDDGRYFVQGVSNPRLMFYATRNAANARQITVIDTSTIIDTPTLDTNFHVYGTRRSELGDLKMQVDAGDIALSGGVPLTVPAKTASLGFSTGPFAGSFAGLVLQDAVYADDNSASAVHAYLAEKAGITL